jgi:ketosteroid isomerase-like protein
MAQEEAKPAPADVFDFLSEGYAALSRGETDAYLPNLHDDVEMHQTMDIPGTAGVFRGKQGAVDLLDEIAESFGDIEWNPRRAFDLGNDRYLLLLQPRGRGIGSGIEIEAKVSHLIQLRDGKVSRLDAYLGWDSGFEAAGLPPQAAASDSA